MGLMVLSKLASCRPFCTISLLKMNDSIVLLGPAVLNIRAGQSGNLCVRFSQTQPSCVACYLLLMFLIENHWPHISSCHHQLSLFSKYSVKNCALVTILFTIDAVRLTTFLPLTQKSYCIWSLLFFSVQIYKLWCECGDNIDWFLSLQQHGLMCE